MTSSGYGDKAFWDKRYEQQDGKYDWYLNYTQFADVIVPQLSVLDLAQSHLADNSPTFEAAKVSRSKVKILVVGCGNSELSEQLHDDGFQQVTSIDYSEIVIHKMQEMLKNKPKLTFDVMDVRELKYSDESFDCVIDKGTLDAILCGSDSARNANMMLSECYRVLKKGKHMFLLTYGQPSNRLNYLEKAPKFEWKVSHQILGKTRHLYTMHKKE